MDIGVIAVVMVAGGIIAGSIAYSRTGSSGTFVAYFIFGALLPLIGIVVACLQKAPSTPPQPPGWYADPWVQGQWRWWDGSQWAWQTAVTEPTA